MDTSRSAKLMTLIYYLIIRLKNINVFDSFKQNIVDLIANAMDKNSRWLGYFNNLKLFLYSDQYKSEYLFSLHLLLTEKNKIRHKKVFTENLLDIDYLDQNFPNKIAHLSDSVPIYLKALSKILDPIFENDTVKSEIEFAITSGKKLVTLIQKRDFSDSKKIYDLIKDLEDVLLSDNRPISNRLNYYTPNILKIIESLKEKLSNKNIPGEILIDSSLEDENNFNVICDESQLYDVLKNLTYDVLRDRLNNILHRKVYISFKAESGTTFVRVHNNWIDYTDALNLVQMGNSITTHRHMLNHFGGVIKAPTQSYLKGYMSMIEINLKSY